MTGIDSVILERWHEALGNQADASPDVSDIAVLQLVFTHSPHLTEIAIAETGLVLGLAKGDPATAPAALIDLAAEAFKNAEADDLNGVMYDWKRRICLSIAWHDLAGTASFEDIGRAQSLIAAVATDAALQAAWTWARGKGALAKDISEEPVGLFILGLGKLGGEDLNYSSDIDLVSFFESDLFLVGPAQGRTEVASRILKRTTETLTKAGWRVDWRLRPDPSVTPLSITSDAALNYYFFHSDPWERLAFAKARTVAGDQGAAEGFLAELGPYIWRRNLDYAALAEIRALKETIHARHPGLAAERVREWRDLEDWGGFNVKLGVGGIREIEFTVQALQLLWGGRDETLRTRHTLTSIKRLTEHGRLRSEERAELRAAYKYLRRLENRLQMVGNQQVHQVSEDAAGQEAACALMGEPDLATMNAALAGHTRIVFETMNRYLDDVGEAPATPQGEAHPIITRWSQGLIPATRGQAGRKAIISLAPQIHEIAIATGDVDDALERFDRFLSALPASSGYLSLIAENPVVLNTLADGLISAPAMATLLEQSPHLIDRLIAGGEVETVPDVLAAQQNSAPHEEAWLERLRRITNEELFAIYAAVLRSKPVEAAEVELTYLAESVIGAARNASASFLGEGGVDPVRIGVLGFGKLGMRRMLPLSDLDLMFFIDELADEADRKAANRLVSRTVTALSTKMREGVAYEIDMRLRPNGRASPPLVSRTAFEKYHAESGKSWEHLALTAARQVVGHQSGFELALRKILMRPRDGDQLTGDVARMLLRLREHRITESPPETMAIKLRKGGLMELEFLISALSLRAGAGVPGLFEVEHDERLVTLAEAGSLDAGEADALTRHLRFYRSALFTLRLLGVQGKSIDELDPSVREKCLMITGCETDQDLVAGISAAQTAVSAAIDTHILEPAKGMDMDAWEESPVKWTD